jgi:hypothetical protein
MVRDVEDDKIDYTLVLDGPMFVRWAEHLTKGARKYAARNWMKARGDEELTRFKRSALRHFLQWYWGHRDEDHASAVFFNINGAEYVEGLMAEGSKEPTLITPTQPPLVVPPKFDCGNRYSHSSHYRDSDGAYCPGRSFDRT